MLCINCLSPSSNAKRINRWIAPGTHTWTVPEGVTSVEVLVVGGGGGGGRAGGGGGGGVVHKTSFSVSPGVGISVVIGAGGDGYTGGPSLLHNYGICISTCDALSLHKIASASLLRTTDNWADTGRLNGDDSGFGSITAKGGGGGGYSCSTGQAGGSGGGGGFNCDGKNGGAATQGGQDGMGSAGGGNTGGSTGGGCGNCGGGGGGALGRGRHPHEGADGGLGFTVSIGGGPEGCPSRFCRTVFNIERAALAQLRPDPHSCAVLCGFLTGYGAGGGGGHHSGTPGSGGCNAGDGGNSCGGVRLAS